MAIGNYGELAAAVAGWLARDDLAGRIPSFIALAEAAFNREFRVRAMEQRATTATVETTMTPSTISGHAHAWPSPIPDRAARSASEVNDSQKAPTAMKTVPATAVDTAHRRPLKSLMTAPERLTKAAVGRVKLMC